MIYRINGGNRVRIIGKDGIAATLPGASMLDASAAEAGMTGGALAGHAVRPVAEEGNPPRTT